MKNWILIILLPFISCQKQETKIDNLFATNENSVLVDNTSEQQEEIITKIKYYSSGQLGSSTFITTIDSIYYKRNYHYGEEREIEKFEPNTKEQWEQTIKEVNLEEWKKVKGSPPDYMDSGEDIITIYTNKGEYSVLNGSAMYVKTPEYETWRKVNDILFEINKWHSNKK